MEARHLCQSSGSSEPRRYAFEDQPHGSTSKPLAVSDRLTISMVHEVKNRPRARAYRRLSSSPTARHLQVIEDFEMKCG